MPPKFRTLFDLLHDQLFYEPDRLVIITETECAALGLTTGDVINNLAKMRELGLVGMETSGMKSKDVPKPAGKNKELQPLHLYANPLTDFENMEEVKKSEWVLSISLTSKFDEFYNEAIAQKTNDELSYRNGIFFKDGVKYVMESETKKAIVDFLWLKRRVMKGNQIVSHGESWQKQAVALQIGLLEEGESITPAVKESLKQEFNQLNRTFKEKGFPIKITTRDTLIQLIETK